MQSERGHRSFSKRDLVLAKARAHLRKSGRPKRHMVHGAGSVERVEFAIAQIFLQASRIVQIDTDDVHHPKRLRITATVVQPYARKLEGRSKTDGESHDASVEML